MLKVLNRQLVVPDFVVFANDLQALAQVGLPPVEVWVLPLGLRTAMSRHRATGCCLHCMGTALTTDGCYYASRRSSQSQTTAAPMRTTFPSSGACHDRSKYQ